MRFLTTHPLARVAAAAFVAAGATLLSAGSAAAAPVDILYTCEASTFIGPVATTFDASMESTAPEAVAPGETFTAVVTPQPNQVPSVVSGLPLLEVNSLSLTIPVPANTTLVSASLSGGSGLGGEPVLTQSPTALVISVPSAIAGGADYQLPTVTMELVAGTEGTVDVRVGGTSLTDPGLTLTAVADFLGSRIQAPTVCFPNPSPVLSTTTISAPPAD
jgi:dehydratase